MNQLDKCSYTLFLSSTDKVSGSNNNASYQVNWDDFLPRDIEYYKTVFSFQTAGGYYRDNYSQFQISNIGASTQPSFQTATAPTYNASTGYTSILISVITNIFYANNYIVVGGTNYLIIQGATVIGNTMIVQGNPTIALNTTYLGINYTQLTGNTIANYQGSLSVGQIINSNGISFTILNVANLNTNATNIIVSGQPTNSNLPLNTTLYASNNTTYNGCKVVCNLLGRTRSFDTSTKSPSLTLGYGFRDVQIATSNSNCLSTFYMQNPPKTIQRPNQNIITIQIYNNSNVYTNGLLTQNQLLVNTDYFSNPLTDMTGYSMIIEFIPVDKPSFNVPAI